MAFVDGSVTERNLLVEEAGKSEKMARTLTHGSGALTEETADLMDVQCLFLQVALQNLGYASGPASDSEAIVSDGDSITIGDSTYTFTVSDNVIQSIEVS